MSGGRRCSIEFTFQEMISSRLGFGDGFRLLAKEGEVDFVEDFRVPRGMSGEGSVGEKVKFLLMVALE